MAVYSMTGYASVERSIPRQGTSGEGDGVGEEARLSLEIRSVNSRFLDIAFRLPDDWRAHEASLREMITTRLKRGKVEVRGAVEHADGTATLPGARALQRLTHAQDQVRAWFPQAAPLSVAEVLRLADGGARTPVDAGDAVRAMLLSALDDLKASRAREGARLAAMLSERIEQLRALATEAAPLVPQLVEQQRQRFLARWREAMQAAEGQVAPEAAQDRALTEATAFAIRIDVAEELTRLSSHLDEITRLLGKGGEVGKRLDFLIQELHREANTLGSKSAALELTKIGVDMKVLIEQMREQVQNIE